MSSDYSSVMPAQLLQAAMSCLDLSLEAELALYRRHHAQSLVALAEATRLADHSEDYPTQTDSNAVDLQQSADLSEQANSVRTQTDVMPIETQIDTSRALIPFVDASDSGEANKQDEETLPKPYGAEITAEPKAFERFLDPSIEDYLESSEALLKHLEDSAASTDQQVKQLMRKSWVKTLRNIAIALGGIAAVIFLGMIMVQWFAPKPRKTDPVPQSSAQPLQSPVSNANQPILTAAANAKPLNSLSGKVDTIVTASQKTLPVASPTPSEINKNAAYYAVVADYTNQESLQKARKLVPDAFMATVEGQQRIQLAWLNELQPAQKLVADLKNEGFAASIVAQN